MPFGRVVDGMSVLSAVYAGYRERPKAAAIRARGDTYLKAEFPKLSYIVRAQQVAFVEEPFALSKNATGLLITLAMVAGAALCCSLARHASLRALSGYKTTAPEDDIRPRMEGDESDDDEGDEDAGSPGKPA